MAYHPGNARLLRDSARRAVGEAPMRSKDPAAVTPLGAVASARGIVESWLPFLDAMVACRAMEGFGPVQLDESDVRLASLYARQNDGWLVSADAGDPVVAATTADDAAALGALLATRDARELVDSDDELRWLAAQLATIAADDGLLATFTDELGGGAHRWTQICDALAIVRIGLGSDADPRLVDAVFRAVAALHPDLGPTSLLLETMEPYSAALLLTYADMPVVELGVAAFVVLSRWWVLEGQWVDSSTIGDRTADILFRRLAAEPAAATQFLLETSWAAPPIPFVTANDQRNVAALLDAGTSPALIDAHTAGMIIVPIMQWFIDDGEHVGHVGTGPSVAELTAKAAAPWLLYFVARTDEWTPSEERAEGWGWESATQGQDALAEVLHDGAAYRSLELALFGLGGAVAALVEAVDTGGVDRRVVADVSATMRSLIGLMEQQEVAWGEDERLPVDVMVFTTMIVLALWDGPSLVNIAGELVTAEPVVDLLEKWGVIPPDDSEVRRRADSQAAQRAIDTSAFMLSVVLVGLVRRGVVSDDDAAAFDIGEFHGDCPLDQARLRFGDFVERLGLDEELEEDIEFVLDSMLRSGEIAC